MNRKFEFSALSLVFLFNLLCIPLTAQDHDGGHKSSVGKINFPVSATETGQKQFNHALAMLHHMMYDHAEKEFKAMLQTDPDCAMAYWGIAMSAFHPLWHDPSKDDLKRGWEAVQKAKSLNAPTQKERDYITAAESIYKDWENITHPTRLSNWVSAQENLYNNYPDDIDAGAFFALSLLAAAPKDDKTFANQKKAGELLEQLHSKAPDHPGLFHYIIHAYDNPLLAERAVDVARAYDKLAPDVPHALHMPSHIFVRLGLWDDAISWNIRSAASAMKHSLSNAVSLHYAHALDYMMYSYLQQGKDNLANDILNKINEVENHEDNMAAAYGVAAGQARFVLERKAWEEAAVLPVRTHKAFPWDKYPWCEAITYFTRGLGSARSNNLTSAKNAVETLDQLYMKTVEMKQNYWAVLVDAQRTAVSAWIAHMEGKEEEALQLMQKAADLEDSMDKHPVTPGAVLPLRELLGDMYMNLERYSEALECYEKSLKTSPNRFYSIYGAGTAAKFAGNRDKADEYSASLKKLTSGSERTELPEVKSFLAGE